MKTVSVQVGTLCVPCMNRCRYCLLSYDGRVQGAPWEASREYAARFFRYIREERPDLRFTFFFGSSMEHPHLSEAIDFLQQIGSPTGEFLQFDGMKNRGDAELKAFLTVLKRQGIRLIDLTFYGLQAYHDAFAGRAGDYELMLRTLRAANEIGLPVQLGYPLTQESAPQAEDFLRETAAYRVERLRFFVPHAEGRGRLLDEIRLTKGDYDALSENVKAHFSRGQFKTEGEWVREGRFSVPEKRVVTLMLTKENLAHFESLAFPDTIAYLEKLDNDYYGAMPPLEELAKLYGDVQSEKMYSERDLYLHYQAQHIAKHKLKLYDINDERQCFSRRF